MDSVSEEHLPVDGNKVSPRIVGRMTHRGTYGRILFGIVIVGSTLPMMLVFAPLQTRWLTAVGMSHVYAVIDGPEVNDWQSSAKPGLDRPTVIKRLEVESGGDWQVVLDNPDLNHDLKKFAHEDSQHPSVVAFRKATADLVPAPFDVFEVARRVRRLTHHETDFGGHEIWDCLTAARANRGLWCHHFCRLFAAVCTSRGYTTRLVSLSCRGNHFDHAVCEIYVPEMGGWMMIDVDFEVAYRSGNGWLTAVEIQQIWKSVREDVALDKRFKDAPLQAAKRRDKILTIHDLEIVEFGQHESHLRDERFAVSPTGLNLELFEYVFLAVRDDYLSEAYPYAHPRRIGQICFRADSAGELIEVCPEAHYSPLNFAYAPIGRSSVQIVDVGPGPHLSLRFASSMPNLEFFQVRQDQGDWQVVEDPKVGSWMLLGAVNALAVRAVNQQGVAGPATELRIEERY